MKQLAILLIAVTLFVKTNAQDSTIVRPGEYKFISARYISRGKYDLVLYNRFGFVFVPGYSSHSWKKKAKFHRYYSINSYGIIKPL